MKKLMLFLGLVLLLSSFASALEPTENIAGYYKSDTDGSYDDATDNNIDGTIDEATFTTSGYINGAYDFDGDNDFIDFSTNWVSSEVKNRTIRAWIYRDDDSNFPIIVQRPEGSESAGDFVLFVLNGEVRFYLWKTSGNTAHIAISDTTVPENEFVRIAAHYDSDTDEVDFYIGDTTETKSMTTSNADINGRYIGRYNVNYADGKIDEVAIWEDRPFSEEQIEEIDNLQYPFPIEFELTASNLYNGSSISTFNATITNATTSSTIETTNGSIFWPNDQIVNITVEAEDYFTRTYTDVNTSTNLDAELWQAVLVVNAREKFTNSTITDFNVTSTDGVYTQFNTSNASGNVTLLVNADTYNLSGKAAMYDFNATNESISVSVGETRTVLMEFVSKELNVSALQFPENTTISNFTAQLRNDDLGILYNITTTDGLAQLYGVNGTYEVTVFADGFSPETKSIDFINTSQNETFLMYATNSIYFRFFDQLTEELINQDVELELISDVFAENYNISNGTLLLELLSPTQYTIRAKSEGYATTFYQYNLEDNTDLQLDVYLLNSSADNFQTIDITVFDQDRTQVENAFVKVLRYDISTNSYEIVEIVVTNFEGTAQTDVILNEEFYKFIVEYQGETRLITDKTQIFETSLSFQIVIGETVGDTFFTGENVDASIIYQNSSDSFRYYFNDPSNTVTKGCLEVLKINYQGETQLSRQCENGISGILFYTITPENGSSFVANGYVSIGSEERLVDSERVDFLKSMELGQQGWFLLAILTIALAFVGLWNIQVALVLVPVPLFIFSRIGWVNVNPSLATAVWVLFLIIAALVGRSS